MKTPERSVEVLTKKLEPMLKNENEPETPAWQLRQEYILEQTVKFVTTLLQAERQKRDEMVGAIEEFASYLEGKRIVVSRGASSGRKEDYPNFPEWAYKENVVSKREEIPNSVVAALLRDRLQPFTQTNNPK